MLDNFVISEHPLIQDKLARLRDEALSSGQFARLIRELSMLLAYEVTRDFPIESAVVAAPSGRGRARGQLLPSSKTPPTGNPPVLVPILRTGYSMCAGFQEVMPDNTYTGHIGIHQNKSTREMVEYFISLPDPTGRCFIVVDPVIATGETASRALEILKENDVSGSQIHFASIVMSRIGAERLSKRHPDVRFHCAAIDAGSVDTAETDGTGLNDNFQVIPGLGSVSQRLFGFRTTYTFTG